MKIYVAVVEELRRKKKDRMKPSLSPIIIKIGGKTSLGLTDLFGFETHLRVWCIIMSKLVVLAP